MEIVWGEEGGEDGDEGQGMRAYLSAAGLADDGLRPVTGVCGMKWRRARDEQLSRLNDKIWMLVDDLQKNPTDVGLLSRFETACKDNGDHNTRLRVLAAMLRIAGGDEHVRNTLMLNQGYALGDRLFWHAKACRFGERERDFALWAHTWTSGKWAPALAEGHSLPVLPFYALVFPFNMTQVKQCSEAWARKFGAYVHQETLPSPFPNTYLRDFSGGAPSRRLKIGYISSDIYRVHPVGKSINACLRMHDPSHFEVYAFLLVGDQVEEASELPEGTLTGPC